MKDDVIVIGLGAMGSAAAFQLARSGARVRGFDRYDPPHVQGSTHGDTRITRLAIGEGAEYVPLVQRSHEIWREVERETGSELLVQCGGLVLGVHNGAGQHNTGDFLDATVDAAERFGIDHETLTTAEVARRYPQLALAGREDGYYEPAAGYVRPERAVRAQLDLARRHGAALHTDERVLRWTAGDGSVTVTTDRGTYTAATLVVTAGPWVGELVPEIADLVTVTRQVLYWFDIADEADHDAFAQLPVYIWEFGDGADDCLYGFPAVDGPRGGVKLATEQLLVATTPDDRSTTVTDEETAAMYEGYVKDRFPGLSSRCVKAASCLYTTTPDARFLIDVHPDHDNVIVASPCSGHGFKHSAAIGEALAQRAATGTSALDLGSFGLSRFG